MSSVFIGAVLRGCSMNDWQDTGYVLSFFRKRSSGKRRYLEFVKKGLDLGRRPELIGGGLVRSLGGWFEVLASRARGVRQVSDQRVLGGGEFVEQVLSEMDTLSKENLRIWRKEIDLSSLAKKVCDVDGVSIGEFRSGSRRREIVNARGVFSW